MRPRTAGSWAQADAEGHDDYVELSPVVRRRKSRGSGPRIAGGQPSAGTAGARVAMPERGFNRVVDCGEPSGGYEEDEADGR
jgi:hypothetical protein